MKFDGIFNTAQSEDIHCVLKIADNGETTLECDSLFSNTNKFSEENIYGQLEVKKVISLIRPTYRRKSEYGSTSILSPRIALISEQKIIEVNDLYTELKITEFGFTIYNINQLFCENRYHEEQDYHSPYDKYIKTQYHYNSSIIYIEIRSHHDFSDGKRRTYIILKSDTPFNLTFFKSLNTKFLHFYLFA